MQRSGTDTPSERDKEIKELYTAGVGHRALSKATYSTRVG
jgi:hypothetical protein